MGEAGSLSTCWTTIRQAALGNSKEREAFARTYMPIARSYLAARWQKSAYLEELDDAVQQVFVECFRQRGALERADPLRSGGFRPFFFSILLHVALRFERRKARSLARRAQDDLELDECQAREAALSGVFDRAWAKALMKEAGRLQARQAKQKGVAAQKRVDLLRVRFEEGLPIREIAVRWKVDPAYLHHALAKARREFKAALLEVIKFHHPDSGDPEGECTRLFELLG
jgi:DNA-directed RNA polymerase specialized sigma24 family protein